jgi:Serpentine type 7TM GPCR chemoreceptor Srw.
MFQVEKSDSIQTQENKITITLIAVVILFMVCQIPTAITLIYELFLQIPESVTERNIRLGLGNIFNFLVTINAACNFMLYCALSDKYRRTFLLTFLPSCYNPRSPSRHNTMYSSMYDGTCTLRRSVRTSSLHVPALSCDNGEVFRHTSNYTARKQKNEGQLPLQPTENNIPSLLVESHLSLSSSIPN